jgi:hypothetical protein
MKHTDNQPLIFEIPIRFPSKKNHIPIMIGFRTPATPDLKRASEKAPCSALTALA